MIMLWKTCEMAFFNQVMKDFQNFRPAFIQILLTLFIKLWE
jgi:hypothetical protein